LAQRQLGGGESTEAGGEEAPLSARRGMHLSSKVDSNAISSCREAEVGGRIGQARYSAGGVAINVTDV